MRKNGKKVAVMLLLAFVAVGSYYVSGTYAKYTKAFSGTDTATVAKFIVSASNLKEVGTEGAPATIDLFKTITEEFTGEDNVKENLIAPGTKGSFDITLTNSSEVDVEAKFTFEETSNTAGVPIEYSLNGTTWKKAADAANDSSFAVVLKYADTPTTKVQNVQWRWAFEESGANATAKDTLDTTIGGTSPAPTVQTTVKVTFTQINK